MLRSVLGFTIRQRSCLAVVLCEPDRKATPGANGRAGRLPLAQPGDGFVDLVRHKTERTAFAATDVFLRINGIFITAGALSAYDWMMELCRVDRFVFEELERWLRENSDDRR